MPAETGRELQTADVCSLIDEVPPISKIKGVNLVTEGIITMNHCTKLLDDPDIESNLSQLQENGATMLLKELLQADKITIFFGTQLNQAYEKIKPGISLRNVVIEKLTKQLQALGKDRNYLTTIKGFQDANIMTIKRYRYNGEKKFRLEDYSTTDTAEFFSREAAEAQLATNQEQMSLLQERLYAENKEAVLIYFPGNGCLPPAA